MFEQGFVDLGEPLQDGGVRGDLLAQLNEGADDVDAHDDGALALEHVGGLQCAVLGEGVRELALPPRPGFEVTFCDIKSAASSL